LRSQSRATSGHLGDHSLMPSRYALAMVARAVRLRVRALVLRFCVSERWAMIQGQTRTSQKPISGLSRFRYSESGMAFFAEALWGEDLGVVEAWQVMGG